MIMMTSPGGSILPTSYNADCFQEKLDRFINAEHFFPFYKWSNVLEQLPLKVVCEIDTSMLSNLLIYQENISLKDLRKTLLFSFPLKF